MGQIYERNLWQHFQDHFLMRELRILLRIISYVFIFRHKYEINILSKDFSLGILMLVTVCVLISVPVLI